MESARHERTRNGRRDGFPLPRFGPQLPPARRGEAIILGAPVSFGLAPGRGEPPSFLHAVQRGKQRAGLHLKGAVGDLRDAAENAESMAFGKGKSLQDQKIEGALQKIGSAHSRIDTLYESPIECQ